MPHSVHRRGFLGQAVVGSSAAGLAMSAMVHGAEQNRAAQITVGVMGLSRGRALAVQFANQANVDVKYVCDVDSIRAAECAKSVEKASGVAPQPIGDFRRILDDTSVDALICAAPNHWHGPATILACSAGKHVYVEKPCSHNPQEGEWMVEAARKHHRAVQMGAQRRSGATMRDAIAKLHDRIIGRVYLARSWYVSARGPIGRGNPAAVPPHLDYDLWQGPAPRRPYLDHRIPYQWHWFWHWGNGELGNNGVHTLDICRWGLDVDFPSRVTSSGGRYAWDDEQETPDTNTVCFEFDQKRSITWQGLSCNRHGSGFVTFYGDEGTLELAEDGSYIVYDKQDKRVADHASEDRGDTEHITNFLAAIRNDAPRSLNAEIAEGHKSTLLCHLGNMAYRTATSLRCDPTSGRVLDNADAMKLWQRDYEEGWTPSV